MNILLTAHQFFPEFATGTEVLTYKVAKQLQRAGHEVTVLTGAPAHKPLADCERFDCYEYDGIRVERFWHDFVPMGAQTDVMEMEYDLEIAGRHFRGMLGRVQPDAVHFFHFGRLSSSLIPECVAAGIPAYYTPTDFWAACPLNQLLLPNGDLCRGPDKYAANCVRHLASLRGSVAGKTFARLPPALATLAVCSVNAGLGGERPTAMMVRSASRRRSVVSARLNKLDAIFAPNRFMLAMLEHNGVERELMHLLPYGIDLNFEIPARQPHPHGHLRVGFIGTLSEQKGAHLLIEALRQAPDLAAELQIFGDPAAFPDYSARLRRLAGGDGRIRFCGTFDNAQIGRVFSTIDVLVVPSIWYENTPLVIYSAQACACPVVASDIGAISEVITDGVNGLLFPVGRAAAIAQSLRRLDQDRRLLVRLAANARRPQSIDGYVAELLAAYRAPSAHRAPSKQD